MKKLLTLLSLSAVAAAVAFGVASNRVVKETKATGENYIPFTIKSIDSVEKNATGNFTITSKAEEYKTTAASTEWVADQNATYWNGGASFNALDNFYRGELYGDWQGTIVSKTWTQTTRYVYFTLGGRAEITIKFFNGDTEIGSMTNDLSNGNPMMVNYWYIPAEKVNDETLASGFTMHLEIIDNYAGPDYGFANFGYLHVNATREEISDAMWDQMNALKFNKLPADVDENRFRSRWTISHYLQNSKFDGIRELSSKAKTNVDETFDDNANFIANWYRDENYDAGDLNQMHEDTIIADFTHRIDGSNFPTNKTGSGFFKGFYEYGVGGSDKQQGFVPTDGARYRFVSRPFKLSGTGFISIKMAGRSAALHVLRGTGADKNSESSHDLLWANNKAYKGDGSDDNIAISKLNPVTMVRHVINLSAFLGEVIQLAIVDYDTDGGWGAVNFDELITYYGNYPTFKVDRAVQKDTIHPYYLDKYISSVSSTGAAGLEYLEAAKKIANTVDDSPVNGAYGFLTNYYQTVRSESNGLTHCNKNLNLSGLQTAYNGLSADAKAIVNGSKDFDYGSQATSENWWESAPTIRTMSESLIALGFAVPGVSSAPIISEGVSINNNSAVIVPVAIGSGAIVISVLVFFVFRRKKN